MAVATQARQTDMLSALRGANFRLYFAGQLVSTAGTWMQNVAQAFLVFQLTQQPLWLGLVACAAGLPLVLLSPIAGVIVERVPRRDIMLVTQTIQMILAFILTALTLLGAVQVWHVMVLAFLLGITSAVDNPSRQAIVFELVGREDLQSGIALNSILNSASRVIGPAAAGIALVKLGVSWCFFLNGLSFLAVIVSLALMRVPYAINRVTNTRPLEQLKEGLSYARSSATITPLLLLTASVGFFSLPILQVFAAFAAESLHSPDAGYAAVSVGQGIGSFLAGVVVTYLAFRIGRGRLAAWMIVLLAIVTVGLAAVPALAAVPPLKSLLNHFLSPSIFPISPLNWVTLTAAAVTIFQGLFTVTEVVCINTMIQNAVPDQFRGRVLALYSLAFFGLAPFGALVLGAISNVISTASGIALWGVIGGVIGIAVMLRWSDIVRNRAL